MKTKVHITLPPSHLSLAVALFATLNSQLATAFAQNIIVTSQGRSPANAPNFSGGGLFTVRLGDTTLANMMALDAALFTQPNLQLRIWFSDGVNGFSVLNPVQDLTFAPYAAYAAQAAFSQSASNLIGTLPSANLAGT